MPPATKKTIVYVLSVINVDHSLNYTPQQKTVGVYVTKDDACKAAGSIQTDYGTFDGAIQSMFPHDHIDNRNNPPDNGVLLQIGSQDTGEGDYVQLIMERFPLLGNSNGAGSGSSDGKKKATTTTAATTAKRKATGEAKSSLASTASTKTKKPKSEVSAASSSAAATATAKKTKKAKSEASSTPTATAAGATTAKKTKTVTSKQKKVNDESTRNIDETGLMVLMKDIMKPTEHKRVQKQIKELQADVESEAAPLRHTREHIFSIPYDAIQPENLFEKHVGDFWGMFETRNYMRAHVALADAIHDQIAIKYYTVQPAWDVVIGHYQELMRLCSSDNLGIRYRFPFMLLRLDGRRDDDAFCFIRYWIKQEAGSSSSSSSNEHQKCTKLHKQSKQGDWLYGHQDGARHLNVFTSCPKVKSEHTSVSFLVALACIKARLIAYNNNDDKKQNAQLDRLIELIHQRNPTVLPALINPTPLLSQQEPYYTSEGTPAEAYAIVKDADPIWNDIDGALERLRTKFGTNPSYDCILN